MAGIGLALFAFQVQDGLELVGEHLRDVRRVVLLHNLSIAISCLLLATSAFWVTRSYNKGYVVALVGLLLAVLVAINFRGDYVRMGTFDFFETPWMPWVLPFAGSVAAGIAAGLALPRPKPSPRLFAWAVIPLMAGSAWWAYFDAVVRPTMAWSVFPPTRHLALLGSGGIFAFILAVAKVAEESQ